MTLDEFESARPEPLQGALLALWREVHGDWHGAHEIAQEIESADGAWVHAYLHRKEGEDGNAAYWYRRAGRHVASGNLRAEWEFIVAELLRR